MGDTDNPTNDGLCQDCGDKVPRRTRCLGCDREQLHPTTSNAPVRFFDD